MIWLKIYLWPYWRFVVLIYIDSGLIGSYSAKQWGCQWSGLHGSPGGRLSIKISYYQYRNPHVKDKIRQSYDRLIVNLVIPIPRKDGLYIETGPRTQHVSQWPTLTGRLQLIAQNRFKDHCGEQISQKIISREWGPRSRWNFANNIVFLGAM